MGKMTTSEVFAPFYDHKTGLFLKNEDDKIILLSHQNMVDLRSGGVEPCQLAKEHAVHLTDTDERVWRRYIEGVNDIRESNISNVKNSLVANGMYSNRLDFDKKTRKINFLVVEYTQDLEKGQTAFRGKYMNEVKNPMGLEGAEASLSLMFLYQVARVPWVINDITTDIMRLVQRMDVQVAKQYDKDLVQGVDNIWAGLRPKQANDGLVPDTHGTGIRTATQLGLTAGAWSGGDLTAIEPAIQAMLDYMEDTQDLDTERGYILYLGRGLWKYARRRYDTPEKRNLLIKDSLMELSEIKDIVKNVHLADNEALLLNIAPEQTEILEAVPMTMAQKGTGYVGEMSELIDYTSLTFKHIATSDKKKTALLLKEDDAHVVL